MRLHELYIKFKESGDGDYRDLTLRCTISDEGKWRIQTETSHGYVQMDPKDLDAAVESLSGVRDFVQGIQKLLEEKAS